jgi:hypothetical protein
VLQMPASCHLSDEPIFWIARRDPGLNPLLASSLYTPPPMFAPRRVPPDQRHLDLEEIRLISDLRIMHAKVDELYQLVCNLRKRHSESDIVRYADEKVLAENIRKVDELYLWFVNIKEERDRSKGDYRKLP